MYLNVLYPLLIVFFRKLAPPTFAIKKDMFDVCLAGLMNLFCAKHPFVKLMVKHANMEIALHQDDVNVRWDGKLPTLCIFPLFVSSQSFLKLEGMETFAINV